MSILREMANALERISDRQDDLYKAIEPVMGFAASFGISQVFDQAVLEDLRSSMVSDLDVLEQEARIKYVDGNTAYLIKKGIENPNILGAQYARENLPQISRAELDTVMSDHKRDASRVIQQSAVQAIERANVEISKSVDGRTREVERLQASLNSSMKLALNEVKDLKESFQRDIRKQVNDEVAEVNDEVADKIEELNQRSIGLLAEADSYYAKFKSGEDNIKVLLIKLQSIEERVKEKAEGAFKKAIERVDKVIESSVGKLEKELASKTDNIQNLLSRVEEARKSTVVDYKEALEPKIEELKDTLREKIESLKSKEQELESLEEKINSTMLETSKVAARVSNLVPKTKQKVVINVQRNN